MIERKHEFQTYVYEELVSHLPFTLIGVGLGVAFVFAAMHWQGGDAHFGEEQFHWAHILHIFFSAAAGAAIFRSYRDSVLKAIPVAAVSAVLLCTLSDILVPYIGLKAAGFDAHLHLCAAEHPVRVAASALLGVAAGLAGLRFFEHCNKGFHLIHLLISTAASALYLLDTMQHADLQVAAIITATLFFALLLPCLIGDVLVPLLFVRMKEPYSHEHVHHSGKGPHCR